jgi:hypothetical protein
MKMGKVGIILTLLIMSTSFSLGEQQSLWTTGIEGVITIAPIHPGPISEDVPSSGPLANVSFVIQNEKGIVTSFTTDAEGRFRVSLGPGHYTVAMKEKGHGIRGYGPFDVDVVAGKMTKVEWRCDSRMR